MGQSFGVPDDIDEDDLMGELDALEDELAQEAENPSASGVPSYLQVVHPSCLPFFHAHLFHSASLTGQVSQPCICHCGLHNVSWYNPQFSTSMMAFFGEFSKGCVLLVAQLRYMTPCKLFSLRPRDAKARPSLAPLGYAVSGHGRGLMANNLECCLAGDRIAGSASRRSACAAAGCRSWSPGRVWPTSCTATHLTL